MVSSLMMTLDTFPPLVSPFHYCLRFENRTTMILQRVSFFETRLCSQLFLFVLFGHVTHVNRLNQFIWSELRVETLFFQWTDYMFPESWLFCFLDHQILFLFLIFHVICIKVSFLSKCFFILITKLLKHEIVENFFKCFWFCVI